jgi:MoaA/NifB/PqqE/SkfB family radical SAM enzyme
MDQVEKGITIVLTQRCNLNCKYCLRDNAFRINNLFDINELKLILDISYKHGYSWILTTGGEPFIHPHIFDYLKYLSDLGLKTVIESNGILINKAVLDQITSLKKPSSFQFLISLDDYLPEKHDLLRGEGSFQKAVNAIKIIKNHGFYLHVNRVITPLTNIDKKEAFVKYLDFCDSLNIDSVHFSKVIDVENKLHKYILSTSNIIEIKHIISTVEHKLLDHSDCESLWKYSTTDYCYKLAVGAISVSKNGISPCTLLSDIIVDNYGNLDEYLLKSKYKEFDQFRKITMQGNVENEFDCSTCGKLCRAKYTCI